MESQKLDRVAVLDMIHRSRNCEETWGTLCKFMYGLSIKICVSLYPASEYGDLAADCISHIVTKWCEEGKELLAKHDSRISLYLYCTFKLKDYLRIERRQFRIKKECRKIVEQGGDYLGFISTDSARPKEDSLESYLAKRTVGLTDREILVWDLYSGGFTKTDIVNLLSESLYFVNKTVERVKRSVGGYNE